MLGKLSKECIITYRLILSNAPAIFVCHLMGVLARLLAAPISDYSAVSVIPDVLLCCFFYMYCFDIANQATSVSEDIINKPYRPIPSGLLSIDGANLRWCLSWILCPVILYGLVGDWAGLHFLWLEAWVFFCYAWPKPNHWFFRNAFTTVANLTTCRLVNACVYQKLPEWNVQVGPDIVVGIWVMLSIHLQEFHDMEGDAASGRNTLPLILGPVGRTRLRNATSFFLCTWGVGVLAWSCAFDEPHRKPLYFCIAALHAISAFILAFRTSWLKTKEDDEQTYRLYYYIALFTLTVYAIIGSYQVHDALEPQSS